MATVVTTPGRRKGRHARNAQQRVSPSLLALALLLGIGYGSYTSFIQRGGGAATFGQLYLALISGAGLAVLVFCLMRFQRMLPRELRAGAYGLVIGGSVGFLYSLTGASVLRSSGIGLVIAACAVVVTYYVFYMRDD